MADTPKTAAELIVDFATNGAQAITAQQMRDLVESIVPAVGRFSMTATAPIVPPNTVAYTEVVPGAGVVGGVMRNLTYANGRLTYTGTPDIHVHVAVSLSLEVAANNQTLAMRVARNQLADADAVASEIDMKIGIGGEVKSTAVHYDGMMSTGDYLSVVLRNETSTAVITMRHMYFFILGMMDVSGL